MKFLVLNGPNLNLLGRREPEIYGRETYGDLVAFLQAAAQEAGVELEIRQSNHEGVLIDAIHEAADWASGIVLNPAAYTHTSIALLDALKAVSLPAVEVHLSDITKREDFRRVSYPGMACLKTIAGQGFEGYRAAIFALKAHVEGEK